MTKISLRVYNREIEAMIESGQVVEAIAHCQHILKTFPMHLETYRLLGKAFLETRNYSDAADIFQRVLMSVPEDFVSQVGMSIIRDDEKKLDEAIWHMERAFEVQPSNPAIQDELRKLYGRRDGVQPPKVRLTRDALANMYAQGALYSQAIAEIKAVLADDPNRPDLQVMLARSYSKDGRKKQAIEICNELIKQYPYCFDALRILIDLMPPSDLNEFTKTYRLRVRALDPYAGLVTGSIFNSDDVPDEAVNIELLNYDPNNVESGSQPAWASSLGIKLEPDKGQHDVPEWLSEKTIEIQPDSEAEIITPSLGLEKEISSENEDVPDWMRSSGWGKNTDPTVENSDLNNFELENDEPLAKAEIPDWLKEMAPEEELSKPDKFSERFESILDENLLNSHLQDNLENDTGPGMSGVIINKEIPEEGIPDWMSYDENNAPIQIETESTDIPRKMEPDQDVFNAISSEEHQGLSEEASIHPADDISSWLGEVKREPVESGNDLNEISNKDEDLPDWLKDIGLGKAIDDLDLTNVPITEIPDKSEEFTSEMDQIDPKLEATPEEDLPEWLKQVEPEKPVGDLDLINDYIDEFSNHSELFSTVGDQISPKLEGTVEEDLPEWLKDIGLEKPLSELDIANEPVAEINNHPEIYSIGEDQIDHDIKAPTEDVLPHSLNEIESTQEMVSPNDEKPSTLEPEEEISSLLDGEKDTPDLLESISDLAELGFDDESQIPTGEDMTMKIEPEEDRLSSMDDQDAAMAWLESLAAKQGAKAEELLTKPEDRLEEPPEWVKNSIEDEQKIVDDETIISKPPEPELIGIRKTEENESIIDEENSETKSTNMDEQSKGFQSAGKEELVKESVTSPDQNESSQEETKDPYGVVKSDPDVQLSVLPEDEGQQGGSLLNQEQVDNPELEIDPSQETDISKWLKEVDADEADNLQDPITPKVSEFYGNEITDPLPDWLKEIEKDASSSDWISESERSLEQIVDSNESALIPDEKDIDDIGEIFPTDTSNWDFEDSESEPVFEPVSDEVKPVTSGEWQPIQPEQKLPEEFTNISKNISEHHTNETPLSSKPTGTGMLSKIPAKEIEKEAGTLELAQSFIESGEIKKAIEVYTRLVKKGQLLEGVIHDLRETTYLYPVEIGIWQLLGDAYMRENRLQDALDAYTKAEELLR